MDQEKPEIKNLGLFKVKKDYIKGDIVQQFEKKIKQYYYEQNKISYKIYFIKRVSNVYNQYVFIENDNVKEVSLT